MPFILRILCISSIAFCVSCQPTYRKPHSPASPAAAVLSNAAQPGSSSSSSEPERIRLQQAHFDSSSPAQRKLIRMAQVAVGMDQIQVRMALGAPDRTTTVETTNGTRIAWEYLQREAPELVLSVAGLLRSGAKLDIGSGLDVHTNINKTQLATLIIFDQKNGKVRKIESYR